MKHFRESWFYLRAALAVVGVFSSFAGRVGAQLPLPVDAVPFDVYEADSSFVGVGFRNIPQGYAISNAIYPGWCVEHFKPIMANRIYWGWVYDTLSTNLPPHLREVPWDRLNYVLNHKQGDWHDVQNALWLTLEQGFESPLTTNALEMAAAAAKLGTGFVPRDGQICSLIVEHVDTNFQRLIVETICSRDCTNEGPAIEFVLSVKSYTPGGPFIGRVHGVADECYIIETSEDLVNWTEIYSARSTADVLEFRDPDPVGDRRFYRARVRRAP